MPYDPQRRMADRNSILAADTARIDAGGPGKLNIYSGTKPAGPDTAITSQVLLATLTFSATSFAAPSNGVATANPIAPANPVAGGTASWARITTGGGTALIDLAVGTSGSDVIIGSTTITMGVPVSTSSVTLSQL